MTNNIILFPSDDGGHKIPLDNTFLGQHFKWSYILYFLKKYKRIKTLNQLFLKRGAIVYELECDLGMLHGELKKEFIDNLENEAKEWNIVDER